MGESKKGEVAAVQGPQSVAGIEPRGGQVQVRRNEHEAPTPFGRMAYFAEFLNLNGLYPRWIEDCPLDFPSPNRSKINGALANTVNGLYKFELIHRRCPWNSKASVELATLEWVAWLHQRRLHG